MIEFNKVFIDTSPFIYYLEQNPQYHDKVKSFFMQCNEKDIKIVTSAITVEEYCVFPYRNHNIDLIQKFEAFIEDMDIDVISIDKEIAGQAAKVRAEFKDFKAMQIAAALISNCDLFLTNDKQLKQENKIRCVILDEI